MMSKKAKPRKPITPGEAARRAAGLTLQQAAKKARVVPSYLRRIELHGGAPWVLANRLGHIYNCSANFFLFSPSYFGSQSTSAGAVDVLSEPGQTQQAATSANLSRPTKRYRRPATPILTIIEGDKK